MIIPKEVYSQNVFYFGNVFYHQYPFIEAIIQRFNLKGKTLLSIGSGWCAEEIIFALNGVNVTCVEPNERCIQFVEPLIKDIPNIKIVHSYIQTFCSPEQYDFVYSSSPSDWMEKYNWEEGMPEHYLKALEAYVKDCAIILTYGGNFAKVTNGHEQQFVDIFSAQLKTINMTLIEYWHQWNNGFRPMFVLSKNPREIPYHTDFETACFRWWAQEPYNHLTEPKYKGRRVYQWTEQSKDSKIVL